MRNSREHGTTYCSCKEAQNTQREAIQYQGRTSGATQRGCVMRLTLIVSLLRFRRLVNPKSPIFTCTTTGAAVIATSKNLLDASRLK
jgi:hypothetical protein